MVANAEVQRDHGYRGRRDERPLFHQVPEANGAGGYRVCVTVASRQGLESAPCYAWRCSHGLVLHHKPSFRSWVVNERDGLRLEFSGISGSAGSYVGHGLSFARRSLTCPYLALSMAS